MNLKRKDKMKLVPDGYYCYHAHRGEPCIFASKRGMITTWNGKKVGKEYCKFLHKTLSIQDQVKDCNIRYGYDYQKNKNKNKT